MQVEEILKKAKFYALRYYKYYRLCRKVEPEDAIQEAHLHIIKYFNRIDRSFHAKQINSYVDKIVRRAVGHLSMKSLIVVPNHFFVKKDKLAKKAYLSDFEKVMVDWGCLDVQYPDAKLKDGIEGEDNLNYLLSCFNEKDIKLFGDYYVEGKKAREIAEEEGVATKQVIDMRVGKIRRIFRSYYGKSKLKSSDFNYMVKNGVPESSILRNFTL